MMPFLIFVPFERSGGKLLFNLLAHRQERRSIIITTKRAFSEWVKVFGDAKLTTAPHDRVSHNTHILTTPDDSLSQPARLQARCRLRRKGGGHADDSVDR